MKNFKILLLALLGAASLHVSAQKKTNKANVKWGPDMDVKENGNFEYVIGDAGNSTFLAVAVKKDLHIQRMDGLKTAWQKPLDLKLDKKDLDLKKIILTKNNILVFASRYDKKDNENRLYVSTYDQSGMKPLKVLQPLSVIAADKAANSGSFSVSTSPDRSKVLVRITPPREKNGAERSKMEMYDDGMQLLWSQEFTLPYNDEEFLVEAQRADNDGTVMVLGIKYAVKQERRELKRANKATYEYHLLVYSGDSPAPKDNLISVPDKFLQDMTISLPETGDILCAGLFGNKNSFNARGAYFLRLDRTTKQVQHASYKEFADDLITSYMTEKEADKAKKKADKKGEELELPSFTLHDIIHRDDGGAVLLAEQYRANQECYSDSKGNTYCSMHYFYNDVIAVNIDPQGNIEWATKVPKRQHSVNDLGQYSSFAVDVKGSNIYLVFNDTGENLFLKPGGKVEQFSLTGKDALVVLATIDSKGEVTREALFTPDRRDVILRPRDCVELKDESMFIYASRKKDYRYGLIEFK
ncbi:MAG: hypothetical protein JST98_09300 [Bacteroidetes bacterium]|nr:hypothetical protein [Bacteroidota bacterium]